MMIADRVPGLVRFGEPLPALAREVWLLVHPDMVDLRRIQVVSAWLTNEIGWS
jgi:hypothetical protein